jgi:outer membrane protein assembly factor BamB
VTEIKEGEIFLTIPFKYDENCFYLRRGKSLSCLNLFDKSIAWVVKAEEKYRGYNCLGSYDGNVYLALDDKLRVFDSDGEIINEVYFEGYYKFLLGEYLIGSTNKTKLHVFKLDGKELVMDYDLKQGIIEKVFLGDDLLLVKAEVGISALRISTGKLLWNMESHPWMEKRFPEEINSWRNASDWAGTGTYPLSLLGPLVDNMQYICWCGHVTALDALTGKEAWSWKASIDCVNALNIPPIYRDAKLYVLQGSNKKEENTLYCLDAKTGELIYKTDPGTFMVDAEHIQGFVVGDDFILVGGHKLVAYNVDKRKISWEYQDKTPVFDGFALPYQKGLCIAWQEPNKLFWYESSV